MNNRLNLTIFAGLAFAASAFFVSFPARAAPTTFDAAADFSSTSSSNGVWSYGYKTASGSGPFTVFPTHFNSSGVDFWTFITPPPFSSLPQVAHNPTRATVIFGTGVNNPGELTFHPGKFGELAVVRFTAPANSIYDISALFQDRDTRANSADVSIVEGTSQLFFQHLGGSASFSQSLTLNAGDTIDFQIGAGFNSYFNDNKRISALIKSDIAPVPEPETYAIMLAGLGLLGLTRRRKQVAA